MRVKLSEPKRQSPIKNNLITVNDNIHYSTYKNVCYENKNILHNINYHDLRAVSSSKTKNYIRSIKTHVEKEKRHLDIVPDTKS